MSGGKTGKTYVYSSEDGHIIRSHIYHGKTWEAKPDEKFSKNDKQTKIKINVKKVEKENKENSRGGMLLLGYFKIVKSKDGKVYLYRDKHGELKYSEKYHGKRWEASPSELVTKPPWLSAQKNEENTKGETDIIMLTFSKVIRGKHTKLYAYRDSNGEIKYSEKYYGKKWKAIPSQLVEKTPELQEVIDKDKPKDAVSGGIILTFVKTIHGTFGKLYVYRDKTGELKYSETYRGLKWKADPLELAAKPSRTRNSDSKRRKFGVVMMAYLKTVSTKDGNLYQYRDSKGSIKYTRKYYGKRWNANPSQLVTQRPESEKPCSTGKKMPPQLLIYTKTFTVKTGKLYAYRSKYGTVRYSREFHGKRWKANEGEVEDKSSKPHFKDKNDGCDFIELKYLKSVNDEDENRLYLYRTKEGKVIYSKEDHGKLWKTTWSKLRKADASFRRGRKFRKEEDSAKVPTKVSPPEKLTDEDKKQDERRESVKIEIKRGHDQDGKISKGKTPEDIEENERETKTKPAENSQFSTDLKLQTRHHGSKVEKIQVKETHSDAHASLPENVKPKADKQNEGVQTSLVIKKYDQDSWRRGRKDRHFHMNTRKKSIEVFTDDKKEVAPLDDLSEESKDIRKSGEDSVSTTIKTSHHSGITRDKNLKEPEVKEEPKKSMESDRANVETSKAIKETHHLSIEEEHEEGMQAKKKMHYKFKKGPINIKKSRISDVSEKDKVNTETEGKEEVKDVKKHEMEASDSEDEQDTKKIPEEIKDFKNDSAKQIPAHDGKGHEETFVRVKLGKEGSSKEDGDDKQCCGGSSTKSVEKSGSAEQDDKHRSDSGLQDDEKPDESNKDEEEHIRSRTPSQPRGKFSSSKHRSPDRRGHEIEIQSMDRKSKHRNFVRMKVKNTARSSGDGEPEIKEEDGSDSEGKSNEFVEANRKSKHRNFVSMKVKNTARSSSDGEPEIKEEDGSDSEGRSNEFVEARIHTKVGKESSRDFSSLRAGSRKGREPLPVRDRKGDSDDEVALEEDKEEPKEMATSHTVVSDRDSFRSSIKIGKSPRKEFEQREPQGSSSGSINKQEGLDEDTEPSENVSDSSTGLTEKVIEISHRKDKI